MLTGCAMILNDVIFGEFGKEDILVLLNLKICLKVFLTTVLLTLLASLINCKKLVFTVTFTVFDSYLS